MRHLPPLAARGCRRDQRRRGGRRDAARSVRPDELLLILGSQRSYPCVLTNLTITEQKFTPALVPVRAEADLKLNVLETFQLGRPAAGRCAASDRSATP